MVVSGKNRSLQALLCNKVIQIVLSWYYNVKHLCFLMTLQHKVTYKRAVSTGIINVIMTMYLPKILLYLQKISQFFAQKTAVLIKNS